MVEPGEVITTASGRAVDRDLHRRAAAADHCHPADRAGLIASDRAGLATSGYGYMLVSPLLAATYIVMMCVLTVLAKRLILGRVKPASIASIAGSMSVTDGPADQRSGAAAAAPDLCHALRDPLVSRAGVKVGRRAEISTASAIVPDLVEIGPESFIADSVIFGAAKIGHGTIELAHTKIAAAASSAIPRCCRPARRSATRC